MEKTRILSRNPCIHHISKNWGDTIAATLQQYARCIANEIVAREALSPVDLENRYGLVQEHILLGENALDQLILRPTQECARYHTPIKGLFLCGSGSHPGGGITCGPGALAASFIAKHQLFKPILKYRLDLFSMPSF
jgi:phytoene dehydrogenase-like protein